MKSFYKRDGKLFVRNGKSHLRVGFFGHFTHPNHPGRIGKLVVVQEVLSTNPGNPILPGKALALSFPEMKVNTEKYEWRKDEQFQMGDVKIMLHDSKRRNVETAIEMQKREGD